MRISCDPRPQHTHPQRPIAEVGENHCSPTPNMDAEWVTDGEEQIVCRKRMGVGTMSEVYEVCQATIRRLIHFLASRP